MPDRVEAKRRLSSDLHARKLDSLMHEINLGVDAASKTLVGAVRGRLVVAIDPAVAG
jgi:hypothetical protein